MSHICHTQHIDYKKSVYGPPHTWTSLLISFVLILQLNFYRVKLHGYETLHFRVQTEQKIPLAKRNC